jgi:hypothetical protein
MGEMPSRSIGETPTMCLANELRFRAPPKAARGRALVTQLPRYEPMG